MSKEVPMGDVDECNCHVPVYCLMSSPGSLMQIIILREGNSYENKSLAL